MGLTRDLHPKFVRRYADLSSVIEEAAKAFTRDVKEGSFPNEQESFSGGKPALRRVY
jgi:3-methyl-2-oxobutanoate hydroxymethyltransferase